MRYSAPSCSPSNKISMPPIREHNAPPDPVDEDDMPPLVDNPNPPMTYTFLTDMTPLSFDATRHDFSSEPSSSSASAFITSPPASPLTPDDALLASWAPPPMSTTRAHGKKRDASYIPRPPNAFILFRSSFIRSQQVPGKVEGNHSTLSKIIGKLWKALPREEKDEWEAKAVIAQAEHRKRYPDWRFRPGANAMAKLKVKDGTATRRRSAQSRTKHPPGEEDDEGDPLEERGPKPRDKGKGKARATRSEREESLDDSRCTQIADLIGQGKTGGDLEVAMQEWEEQRKRAEERAKIEKTTMGKVEVEGGTAIQGGTKKRRDPSSSLSRSTSTTRGVLSSSSPDTDDTAGSDDTVHPPPSPRTTTSPTHRRRSRTPSRSSRGSTAMGTLSDGPSLPLTHMFKRSSSAPAPNSRVSYAPAASSPLGSVPHPASLSPLVHLLPSASQHPPPEHTHHHPRGHHVHGHTRRDTVSFPMTASDYPSPQQLVWPQSQVNEELEEGEEERRRFDADHGHGAQFWQWGASPGEMYDRHQQHEHEREVRRVHPVTSEGMGYESTTGLSEFEPGFIEHLQESPSSDPTRDGNGTPTQVLSWGTNPGRLGLVTVVQDPFMHQPKQDLDDATTSLMPLPVLSIPPSLNSVQPVQMTLSSATNPSANSPANTNPNAFFYPPHSPITPNTVPSSSFSSLSGWAGDYHSLSSLSSGVGAGTPGIGMPPASPGPSAWYTSEPRWDDQHAHALRRQLEHPDLHIGPEEWDQMEMEMESMHPSSSSSLIGFERRARGAGVRKVTFDDASSSPVVSSSASYVFGRRSSAMRGSDPLPPGARLDRTRVSGDHEMG